MKYISRIDTETTHCWTVRIMIGKPEQVYKTFSDGRYKVGNSVIQAKKDSQFAAIKYKNKMLKKYKAIILHYSKVRSEKSKLTYDRLKKLPVFKSCGYKLRKTKRKNGTVYKEILALVNNKYLKTGTYKCFPFSKYGGKVRAKEAAGYWVKGQRELVFDEAKRRGIK